MFIKNLNAAQQSALLALANHICEQIPSELQTYNNQSFSVIDAVFGEKGATNKLTKLDILKRQMDEKIQPTVVDITKINEIFDTHRAKLSVIGALIWLNGYNQDTQTDEYQYYPDEYQYYQDDEEWFVLNIDAAETIYLYSQLLKLDFDEHVAPFYEWYHLQQTADQAACNIFPIPKPFEKVEVKG